MRKYDAYKDSGIEWIGEIPSHWELVPIKYSLSIPLTDGPHETPELVSEGVIFISAEAIKEDKIDFEKKRGNITIEDHERFSKKYKPQKGDVYMIKSGATTGNLARVETDTEFNIWSPLAAFRPDPEKITTDFLFFYMKSKRFFTAIELGWNYGTQQNIGMNVLENLRLVRPTIEEQTAIAHYLDRKTAEIDELIADKKRLLELYEEEKTALINQAVTGKAKACLGSDAPMKDSGIEWLGEIPEEWEVKRLKLIVSKIGSGVTPSGGSSVYLTSGIPLIRSQNIHFDGIRLDDVAYISEEIDEGMSNSRIQDGDVLLNITGASIGRCFYVPDGFGKGNVNQHVCIIRPILEKVETIFLYYIMRSEIGQTQIRLQQTGANREGLNFEQLKNFILPLPESNEEQQAIVRHIETENARIDAKKSKTEKLIDLLTEYRTALISEVVTGKVKVSD
ncbi:MAG: restriction endonuclease subunit S [Bacteroidia bacterium]